MAPIWEAWGLAALALFEFAVAYWWWMGPRLEGTRLWVSGIFVLGGISTLRKAIVAASPDPLTIVFGTGVLADRLTNLFLLAFAGIAARKYDSRAFKLLLGVVGAGIVLSAPIWWPQVFQNAPRSPAGSFFLNLPLWLAVFATAAGLAHLGRAHDRPHRDLWLLALSAIGFRFAELTAWLFPDANIIPTTLWDLGEIRSLLQGTGLLAMLGGFGSLLWSRARITGQANTALYDVSLILILSGFLFGFARSISNETAFAVFFSLAFVRPGVFLTVQWLLDDRPFRQTEQWYHLRVGGTAVGASLLAIPLGGLFGMSAAGSVIVGLMLAFVGIVLVRAANEPAQTRKEPATGDRRSEVPELPLSPKKVSLPEDWEDRVRESMATYASLPPETQQNLQDLRRWERLVLALYGAPEGSDLPAYERTTPGLHFLTHAPYASIGAEISRTNERSEQILHQMGLAQSERLPSSEEALIESRMGRAEGLDSPRVKSYILTPLGEAVAEQLAKEIGLEGLTDEEIALVVGEGYGEDNPG